MSNSRGTAVIEGHHSKALSDIVRSYNGDNSKFLLELFKFNRSLFTDEGDLLTAIYNLVTGKLDVSETILEAMVGGQKIDKILNEYFFTCTTEDGRLLPSRAVSRHGLLKVQMPDKSYVLVPSANVPLLKRGVLQELRMCSQRERYNSEPELSTYLEMLTDDDIQPYLDLFKSKEKS